MCFEYFGGHGFPKLTPRLPFTILNGAAGKEVFQYIFKNTFSKCYQMLKKLAMGSPLGAAFFSVGTTNLKRLGYIDLRQ